MGLRRTKGGWRPDDFARYTHNGQTVQAIQWTGHNFDEVSSFLEGYPQRVGDGILVTTVDGMVEASVGDWVVCDDKVRWFTVVGATAFPTTYIPQ